MNREKWFSDRGARYIRNTLEPYSIWEWGMATYKIWHCRKISRREISLKKERGWKAQKSYTRTWGRMKDIYRQPLDKGICSPKGLWLCVYEETVADLDSWKPWKWKPRSNLAKYHWSDVTTAQRCRSALKAKPDDHKNMKAPRQDKVQKIIVATSVLTGYQQCSFKSISWLSDYLCHLGPFVCILRCGNC